jgi:hypothetical protein
VPTRKFKDLSSHPQNVKTKTKTVSATLMKLPFMFLLCFGTRAWRKLHTEELQSLSSSYNIIGIKVNLNVKVKLSLCLTKHHAMKAYRGSGGIAPRIL